MTNQRLCPICRRPLSREAQELRFRPFCSRRCADVDLGRWLKGSYAIPAGQTEDESDDGEGGSGGQDQDGGGRPVKH